jgi:hypothetical protein
MIKRFVSPVISGLSLVVVNIIINGDLHDY